MLTLAITSNPQRVAELRKPLGSLSRFMKALNEPIARRANRADNRTHGRSLCRRFFRCRENRTRYVPCAGKNNVCPGFLLCWEKQCVSWFSWFFAICVLVLSNQLGPRQGFRALSVGKAEKSRSALQSSLMPC